MKYTYVRLDLLCTTKNGDIELVRQVETGLLAVRKKVPVSWFSQYNRIRKIHQRNLVQVYEVKRRREECIVIEEYVDGETLAELLERDGQMEWRQAGKYLYELCKAVCALHKADIVHRDINPNNIMITRDGILKLYDYNISEIMGHGRTKEFKAVGTVGYAPPEQYGYGMTDVQTDIYAMGRTANKMLTGQESKNYHELETKEEREAGEKTKEEMEEEKEEEERTERQREEEERTERQREEEERAKKTAAKAAKCFRTILWQMLSLDKTDRYETADMVLEDLYLVLYDEYIEFDDLSFFAPNFRRTVYQARPVAIGALYFFLGYWQYCVWRQGYCGSMTGRIFCILAWMIFLDVFWISRWLLRMSERQKWFRYVIGFALLMAPILIEG